MSKDNRISASRVAVLAVHGVADQPPEKTARQTAALLLGEQLEVNYQFFNEEKRPSSTCFNDQAGTFTNEEV